MRLLIFSPFQIVKSCLYIVAISRRYMAFRLVHSALQYLLPGISQNTGKANIKIKLRGLLRKTNISLCVLLDMMEYVGRRGGLPGHLFIIYRTWCPFSGSFQLYEKHVFPGICSVDLPPILFNVLDIGFWLGTLCFLIN